VISLIVLICAGTSCQAFEGAMPDGITTIAACEAAAPEILGHLDLSDDAMVMAWRCVAGEPV
jgi:hypothetical protein